MHKNRNFLLSIKILICIFLIICFLTIIFFSYFRHDKTVVLTDRTVSSNGRSLLVTNGITQEMLTYNHWSGNYTPTLFRVSIDGASILPGQSSSVQLNKEDILVARYDYSFVHGYRSGARLVYFQIPSEVNSVIIQFSWQQKAHLLLDCAQAFRTEVVPFDTTIEAGI